MLLLNNLSLTFHDHSKTIVKIQVIQVFSLTSAEAMDGCWFEYMNSHQTYLWRRGRLSPPAARTWKLGLERHMVLLTIFPDSLAMRTRQGWIHRALIGDNIYLLNHRFLLLNIIAVPSDRQISPTSSVSSCHMWSYQFVITEWFNLDQVRSTVSEVQTLLISTNVFKNVYLLACYLL